MLDRLRKPNPWRVLTRGLRALPRHARQLLPGGDPHRARAARARLLQMAKFVAVVLVGAWLGLAIGAEESSSVGPVDTKMAAHLSWSGDTEIRVGPLGTLRLDTHDGPVGVTVTVDQLNVADARALFEDPAALEGLEERIAADARSALTRLVVRSMLAAVIGAVLLALLVYRRRLRRVAVVGATAAAVALGAVGAGAATWNPRSVSQPHYTGLLVSAPSVVGNAENIVAGFTDYSRSLANLVGNVSKLYDVTSTLPTYEPDPSTIRVLHVADIHLNPAAWEVIASVSAHFDVALIIDSGDITDHGSKPERRFVREIADLPVPYAYVRGNHDSQAIADAVAAQPNALVLDDGEVHEVAGLLLAGDADPRFTPDKSVPTLSARSVAEHGEQLASRLLFAPDVPDIAVVHDPLQGEAVDGLVPLVLAGHTHERATHLMPLGSRMFIQGSTGGAGLRALEGAEPEAIQCSVLYFDADTRRLQAWDDITIGGLGLTSAQITRTVSPAPQP